MSRIVGVDPGAKGTGVVARSGDLLVGHALVMREAKEPVEDYILRVLRDLDGVVCQATPDLLAVEGVNKPRSHIGGEQQFVALQPLMDLCAVMGAVIGWGLVHVPNVVVVPPGGNGTKAPLATYPKGLVGSSTTKGTSDALRHCRSAWDVCAGTRGLLLRREMSKTS